MSLSLSLLGAFQASRNGESITEFYSSKVRALLAYLAVEAGREHPRPVLAALLWPDWDDRAALGNLRFSLPKLRQAIRDDAALPPYLLISRDTLQLNPVADVSLDVRTFQQALRASRWEEADVDGQPVPVVRAAAAHLANAMELYRGSFLEGFTVGDSAVFEEWALVKREQLEREARGALHGLTALYARLGDYATAERCARRLLDMDPWDERANQRLMVVLLERGQRNAALRHYAAYQEDLARELGCEPVEETQALYAQIRDGALSRSQPPPAIPSPPPERVSPAAPGRATPILDVQSPPGAPRTHTTWSRQTEDGPPFVAREQELASLGSLLEGALAGQGGVALISGEAGSGKTALLDALARRASQAHGDLIVLRGSCNAHASAGDPYLPFREMLQTLAGDLEGKRAGGTLAPEQARRAWEALPAVGAALVAHGPDLIDRFVPGDALLRRIERYPALSETTHPPAGQAWLARLREIVRGGQKMATALGPGRGLTPQPDLFAQVTQVLHAVSVRRPLLLAIDDLQWADGGTAALLFHLGRRLAGSRIFLVCAYRPEVLTRHPALEPGHRAVSQAASPAQTRLGAGVGAIVRELIREWGDVQVDLDRADGRGFVEAYVDSEPNRLGTSFRQALYDHTGGNPLFTVELMRSFEQQGALVQDGAGRWREADALEWDHYPPQVEAVIAGHMAGLPDEDWALLQAASVEGERFTAEVTAQVLGRSEETVVRRLSGALQTRYRLVEAISVDRVGPSGQHLSRYRFRHLLLQHSAYGSLDEVRQAWLHEATGRALEAVYGLEEGRLQTLAPALAHHFERAGMPLEAARHRLQAGQWATRLVAYAEAIAHLKRGLALLEGVTASHERLRLELDLWLALVNPVLLAEGWQAPAFARAVERLSDLTSRPELESDPQRLAALSMLALTTTWSADPEHGRRVGEQLLNLAHSGDQGDRQSHMLAHWVLGHSHWLRGQFALARDQLEEALALYDPGADRPLGLLFIGEPEVTARIVLGFVLWLLGYPDQGRGSFQQALAAAQEIEQPSTTAFAHATAGVLHLVLGRDVSAALDHAQALVALGGSGPVYGTWAELLVGQAQPPPLGAMPGHAAPGQTGDAGLVQGLGQDMAGGTEAGSALEAVGTGVGHVVELLVQAQILAQAGRPEMGLKAIDLALAWIERTGVQVVAAEVWRMRGELLLRADDAPQTTDDGRWTADDGRQTADNEQPSLSVVRSPSSSAEACFQRALEIAREQQVRWLELRTAVSMARLWGSQGRRDEARALLAGIYGWFSEGFDTVDLVEARTLLDELA